MTRWTRHAPIAPSEVPRHSRRAESGPVRTDSQCPSPTCHHAAGIENAFQHTADARQQLLMRSMLTSILLVLPTVNTIATHYPLRPRQVNRTGCRGRKTRGLDGPPSRVGHRTSTHRTNIRCLHRSLERLVSRCSTTQSNNPDNQTAIHQSADNSKQGYCGTGTA